MRQWIRRRDKVVTLGLLLATGACSENPTTPSLDDIDISANADVVADVQVMVDDALAGWWRTAHHAVPGAALSVAADAHTSSWKNWGMLDVGSEPRNADLPALDEQYGLLTTPWTELTRTLISTRDIILALDAGVQLGDNGADTRAARAYTRFVQGLALASLAQLFHSAFIIDENVDPTAAQLSSYADVMAAAQMKFQDALDLSAGQTFTIPAAWLAFDRALDQDGFVRLVRSQRARYTIAVARTPSERHAVDWAGVLEDVRNGITQDWGGRYDGDYEHNWAWAQDKLAAGVHPLWARMDYRTIGPADASGAYQAWLATAPPEREPFGIDTDDRRITGGTPLTNGTLVAWAGTSIFRANRGTDHFSYYTDLRWDRLLWQWGEGFNPDFPVKELSLIEAEALYQTGNRAGAMEIVNRTRVAAGLPAFTDPQGAAPGGSRCVPKRASGACGDLWEALKYEKRIELFHYGPFTEFTDDRGWGDLVFGTFLDFPAPSGVPESVLQAIYGVPATSAMSLVNDLSPAGLRTKRAAYQSFDLSRNKNPGDLSGS